MSELKVYLDTSILSAYFDMRKPVRQLITQKWFQRDMERQISFISSLVVEEIGAHPEESVKNALKIWEVNNMASYKNDYSKEEDPALWILHEIRHKMATRGFRADEVNRSAKDLLRIRRLSTDKSVK
ncbi:MAG: hypothetical protein HQL23_07270 [Candidatus Omnitrophica bacterium]|nr:hypothetical protein [Candidatus Omnitrophota bacterium]